LTFLQIAGGGWAQGALLTAVSFIVVFGTIVLFHELGHFAVAKAFGVQVFEFSIGIGPKWPPSAGRGPSTPSACSR